MKKILCFTAGIIILSSVFFNAGAAEISASTFIDGVIKTGTKIGYNMEDNGISGLSLAERIGRILAVSTMFLGVVFLGLMIYAGFIWMLARGNEQEVAKAKNIIIYAVIGLVVVLSAYAITNLFNELWVKTKTS